MSTCDDGVVYVPSCYWRKLGSMHRYYLGNAATIQMLCTLIQGSNTRNQASKTNEIDQAYSKVMIAVMRRYSTSFVHQCIGLYVIGSAMKVAELCFLFLQVVDLECGGQK